MYKNAIIVILSVLLLGIIYLQRINKTKESIKDIGSFEYEGSKTQVIQAGDCQVYMTKFKNNENISYFFSCPK